MTTDVTYKERDLQMKTTGISEEVIEFITSIEKYFGWKHKTTDTYLYICEIASSNMSDYAKRCALEDIFKNTDDCYNPLYKKIIETTNDQKYTKFAIQITQVVPLNAVTILIPKVESTPREEYVLVKDETAWDEFKNTLQWNIAYLNKPSGANSININDDDNVAFANNYMLEIEKNLNDINVDEKILVYTCFMLGIDNNFESIVSYLYDTKKVPSIKYTLTSKKSFRVKEINSVISRLLNDIERYKAEITEAKSKFEGCGSVLSESAMDATVRLKNNEINNKMETIIKLQNEFFKILETSLE